MFLKACFGLSPVHKTEISISFICRELNRMDAFGNRELVKRDDATRLHILVWYTGHSVENVTLKDFVEYQGSL